MPEACCSCEVNILVKRNGLLANGVRSFMFRVQNLRLRRLLIVSIIKNHDFCF